MKAKTAVVTGGTGALGAVVVEELVRCGLEVAVPVRPGHRAPESSPHIRFQPADLQKEEDVGVFVRTVLAKCGTIDILVNVAGGYAGGKRLEETPVSEWDAMLELNLKTTFLMCRAVLPLMRKEGFGRIVNIAAMPVIRPGPKKAAYTVSKGGVATLTEAIHEEVKGSGITVNAVAPSTLLTDANRASMPNADTSGWVPLAEVAKLISFLCSDEARSVSGNVIRIFGGA